MIITTVFLIIVLFSSHHSCIAVSIKSLISSYSLRFFFHTNRFCREGYESACEHIFLKVSVYNETLKRLGTLRARRERTFRF